jgi:NADPH:quinone reductase-like Zn-dependent oxidoreductase
MLATSLWYEAKGSVALRMSALPELLADQARIRTLCSAVSRGTERLVLEGRVPASEWQRMRAPMQEGDFPYPVKYGYAAVGVVEAGPSEWLGKTVFCLHPHQDRFNAPLSMLAVVPDGISPARATLAANMETALNAMWDAACGPCDEIAVIGGGVVGLLVGFLAARMPGALVTLVDIEPSRAEIAGSLGMDFATPDAAPSGCDVVFHTSASESGLAAAFGCAGDEARVIEMSWYGDRPASVPLGGAFHSRRLQIIGSQVGKVSPSHRPRWSYGRRLGAALALLADGRLDALVQTRIDFADAPSLLPGLLADAALGLAPVIVYPG